MTNSNMVTFDKYLFRCHSLGKISESMETITQIQLARLVELQEKPKRTEKQDKELWELMQKKQATPKLPTTCTSYLKELYIKETKSFNKRVKSKYFEKGTYCEESGIDILSQTIFRNIRGVIIKNIEEKENEFIKGTCDVYIPPIITDIKNCYDWITFQNAKEDNNYRLQLEGYMELWGVKKAFLFYVLVNMPPHMLQREFNDLFYSTTEYLTKEDHKYQLACEELAEEYNFEKFHISERFKLFQFEKTEGIMEETYDRIKLCRKWLNEYHQKMLEFKRGNLELMGITETDLIAA